MNFIHYAHSPNLTMLHGRMSGTGIKGAERARVEQSNDPRLKKRICFYPPVTDGLPRPEAGLGTSVYEAKLDNLFDARYPSSAGNAIATKQQQYVAQGELPANAYERAVLDAGYIGYRTNNLAVVINHDVPVTYVGSSLGKTFKDHVSGAEKLSSIFDGIPNKDGFYSSAMLTTPQMSFWLKNQKTLVQIAPSAKIQYGRLYVHKNDIEALKTASNPF